MLLSSSKKGFTLIELVITIAIVAILATVALPLTSITVQRSKEQELQASLRQIRDAIDAYKQAVDDKRIIKAADESGYPKSLETLAEGVVDAKSANKEMIYFLRRIPRDPLSKNSNATASETWGKRSYKSAPDDPQEGEDVFDVYSLSSGIGLNGIAYREW